MVSAPRITVTASYRNDRPQVLAILKSAGLPPPVVQNPADIRLGTLNAGPAVAASATNSTGLGFDACAAPGAAVMSAWLAHSSYQAIGIYIGGSDRACLQPNLTAAWVSQQAAAGWHFIPLYVGPQVSFKGEVTNATSQAISAAQDAVVQARTLGFGARTPIYYDMEAYRAEPEPGRDEVLHRVDHGTALAGLQVRHLQQFRLRHQRPGQQLREHIHRQAGRDLRRAVERHRRHQ